MTECNSCGRCCHPLVIGTANWQVIMAFSTMPHPESPEFPAWKDKHLPGIDLSTEENQSQLHKHYADGQFARRHWQQNIKHMDEIAVTIRCPFYAVNRRMCKAYDNRPPICAGYPWHDDQPGSHKLRFVECSYWADVPESERPANWVPIPFMGRK